MTKRLARSRITTMSKRTKFSEQLRKAIEQAPVSRYAIHKATGIDQAVLSKFVRGERTGLSMETVDALCDYLGLKLVPEKKPEKKGR